MALADDEQTVHDGAPIELYEFAISGGSTYRYTSHDEDVTALSNTWTAAAIKRGEIALASVHDPRDLLIEASFDLDIVDELAFEVPPRRTEFTLRRYHSGSVANISQIWHGFVGGTRVSGRTATIRVPSMMSDALRTRLPMVKYQSLCNHVLYDSRCGLTDTDFDLSTTVQSISPTDSTVITLDSIGGAADQVYKAGKLKRDSDGEVRLIIDQTSTVVTVNRPFRSLAVSDAVTAFQGCDRSIDTCDTKFSNSANFGGMPYPPDFDVHVVGIKGG